MTRARSCPACRTLNAAEDSRCFRCGARLPGPLGRAWLQWSTTVGGNGAQVTLAFCAINFVVFGLMHLGAPSSSSMLKGASGLRLLAFGALRPPITDGEWWRLVSANFLHIGILHLAMNSFGLVQIGRDAERLLGWSRYAFAYVLCGVAGFLASNLYDHWTLQFSITAGASASLFGILGVLLGWLVGRKDPRWKQFATQSVVYALVFGFMMSGVNNAAHVGGLAAGVALGVLFARERPDRPASLKWDALGLLSIALVLLSLVLAQTSALSREFRLLDSKESEATSELSP